MERHTKLQYHHPQHAEAYIGTVIDTTEDKITIEPVADASGTPLTTASTHSISRDTNYRVLTTP